MHVKSNKDGEKYNIRKRMYDVSEYSEYQERERAMSGRGKFRNTQ